MCASSEGRVSGWTHGDARQERRSSSIVGVIAALAILSAALVVLSTNVMHNTGAQTMEVKAFNVAEAGLDTGQETLWAAWPGPAATDTDRGCGDLPGPVP